MKALKAASLWLTACGCLVSGCVSKADITLVDVFEVQTIEAQYEPVTNITLSADRQSAHWIVAVRADRDLVRVVNARQMAFLYYRLRPCGEDEGTENRLSGRVYVNARSGHADPAGNLYFAAIPSDFREQAQEYASMRGIEFADPGDSLCIGFGAGSMAGHQLKTNFIRVELQ